MARRVSSLLTSLAKPVDTRGDSKHSDEAISHAQAVHPQCSVPNLEHNITKPLNPEAKPWFSQKDMLPAKAILQPDCESQEEASAPGTPPVRGDGFLRTTDDPRKRSVTWSSNFEKNLHKSCEEVQRPQLAPPAPSSPSFAEGAISNPSKPSGETKFFWDMTYHAFECAKAGCEVRCSMWDSQSVICPFCGPYSYVKYCGKEHMREDARAHWLICGQLTMQEPCVENSIPPDVLIGPPAIPCKHGWDRPERHRQALWFSTAQDAGDYFIFADQGDCTGSQKESIIRDGSCSHHVVQVVHFDDPEMKDRFRRILAVCLLESLEVQPLVEYLFRMLRDRLQSLQQWSSEMDMKVRQQMALELAIELEPRDVGLRHACEAEWRGLPFRHCRDPICVSERAYLLGSPCWTRRFECLVSDEEANYWILRANRTTHPTVKGVYARTRGEGFDHVLAEEQRLFRRGEAWDGLGKGSWEWVGGRC